MNLGLFKFEIKRQLKSIVFWTSIIAAIFFAIKSNDMNLFDLPVETDKEAYEFIDPCPPHERRIYPCARRRTCGDRSLRQAQIPCSASPDRRSCA